MPPPYIEIQISSSEELVDQLIAILSQLGIEGFWEDDTLLKCYVSARRWNPAFADEVRTTITRMHHSSSTPAPVLTVRVLEDKNWNDEWEKTIKPIHVTDHIVITPTWHDYPPAPGEYVLTIDPKMSFGTGYHETTRLVLQLMEKHVRPGFRLLDIGTGTGVLAIAGVKLGAASAVAIDVDEWSYDNALENVHLNRVDDRVQIIHGDLISVPAARFDIVVANIQLNVIASLLPDIKGRLELAGLLILSGLFLSDNDEIMTMLQSHGIQVSETMVENEWIAVAGHVR